MENASKALLMAGSILIALLIIASAVYLIDKAKQPSDAYYKRISAQEVEKYNTEITKNFTIISGENYVTAQGIVTIKNLLETTKYNGQTKIIPPTSEWCNKSNEEILKNYSVDSTGTIKHYKVNYIITNAEGLIININIENP